VPAEETKYKKKFVFEVVTPDQVYVLQAENEASFKEWVENLKKEVKK